MRVDGEQVQRVVGERTRGRRPLLRALLPGVPERDDVVDVDLGAPPRTNVTGVAVYGSASRRQDRRSGRPARRPCRAGRGGGSGRGCRSRAVGRPAVAELLAAVAGLRRPALDRQRVQRRPRAAPRPAGVAAAATEVVSRRAVDVARVVAGAPLVAVVVAPGAEAAGVVAGRLRSPCSARSTTRRAPSARRAMRRGPAPPGVGPARAVPAPGRAHPAPVRSCGAVEACAMLPPDGARTGVTPPDHRADRADGERDQEPGRVEPQPFGVGLRSGGRPGAGDGRGSGGRRAVAGRPRATADPPPSRRWCRSAPSAAARARGCSRNRRPPRRSRRTPPSPRWRRSGRSGRRGAPRRPRPAASSRPLPVPGRRPAVAERAKRAVEGQVRQQRHWNGTPAQYIRRPASIRHGRTAPG